MVGFTEALNGAIRSGFCGWLKTSQRVNEFFNELSPIDAQDDGRYFRTRLCDEDPNLIPSDGVGFTGGQCSGIPYRVRWRWIGGCRNGQLGPNLTFVGPISSITHFPPEPPSNAKVTVVSPNGGDVFDGCGTQNPTTGIEDITVTRLDGQPDTCGNAEPVYPPFPPEGDNFDISVTYDTDVNTNITLDGSVQIFAPVKIFAPVTTIIAPVKVGLGPINFNGTLRLSPQFRFDFSFGDGDYSPGTGDPEDVPEDPITSPTTPDDEENRQLLGVIVRSLPTGPLRVTQVAQGDGPDLFLPRIGGVYFRTRTNSLLGWWGPVDIQLTSQWVPVPEHVFAIDAIAFPVGEWNVTSRKVYSAEDPEAT